MYQNFSKSWQCQNWLDRPPNPGTLVDLTKKAGKCDSQHFDNKSG